MATFTMTLAQILDCDTPEEADARLIGLDSYPIYNEQHRSELNLKIIRRFWNREIGFETVPMFTHHLRRKLGEIMPYYNQLYETETMKFDPLLTLGIQTEQAGSSTGESSTDQTGTQDTSQTESSESDSAQKSDTTSRSINSDFPQTRLSGYEDYASNAVDSKSETNGSSTSTSTGESTGHVSTAQGSTSTAKDENTATGSQTGFSGDRSALLLSFRDTILNIDVMILEELETLFMGVWGNDDSYLHAQRPYYLSFFGGLPW